MNSKFVVNRVFAGSIRGRRHLVDGFRSNDILWIALPILVEKLESVWQVTTYWRSFEA